MKSGKSLLVLACIPVVSAIGLFVYRANQPDKYDTHMLAYAEEQGAACKNGDMSACYELGALYRQGVGVRQNMTKAVELYSRACEGGNASGCADLGLRLERGGGVEIDLQKAAAAYSKACNMGMQDACELKDSLISLGVEIPAQE